MKTFVHTRNFYNSRLEPWIGKPVIKVLTGMRRVGKSCVLRQAEPLLHAHGVPRKRTLFVDKEDVAFDAIRDHRHLAAWVRLDQVRGFFQSLFQTDRYFDGVGYAHWSLNDVRTMRFSVQGAMPEVGRRNESDSVRSLVGDVGRWLHLVAVYDSEAGTVRLYVDGRLDRESRLVKAPPAVLGRGQFGNWKGQAPLLGQDRRLSGRMDEFVALGRAMNDEEVRELHDAGTPYR